MRKIDRSMDGWKGEWKNEYMCICILCMYAREREKWRLIKENHGVRNTDLDFGVYCVCFSICLFFGRLHSHPVSFSFLFHVSFYSIVLSDMLLTCVLSLYKQIHAGVC